MGKVLTLRGRARRPMPPAAALDPHGVAFIPAPEVLAWAMENIVDPGGAIHNEEHMHLEMIDLEFLWTNARHQKQGRRVLGQCEQVMIRAGGWQKARQELQMEQWFGRVPTWLITLDAVWCAECSDAEFCALVEHELYHIGQSADEFGAPAFTRDGFPKLYLRGHDVEEFVGVVRRYGAGQAGGQLSQLVAAANGRPEVSPAAIAASCGTCISKIA